MSQNHLCSTFILVCVLLGQIYALEENGDNLSLQAVNAESSLIYTSQENEDDSALNGLRETRAVDAQIEAFLRKLLTNGIAGLPPLDPLELNDTLNVQLPAMSGSLLVNRLIIEGLSLSGLSSFTAEELSLNTLMLTINFDLSFSLDAHSDFVDLDAIVGDILPFNGNGSIELGLDLRLNGSLRVGTETVEGSEIYIILQSINADITFGEMAFTMSNIMNFGGTHEAIVFNNVMSEVTPQILNLTVDSLKGSLISSIIDLVNGFLRDLKITLAQLLACINGGSACPFDM